MNTIYLKRHLIGTWICESMEAFRIPASEWELNGLYPGYVVSSMSERRFHFRECFTG